MLEKLGHSFALEAQQEGRKPNMRRRTWSEARQLKRDKARDRDHFDSRRKKTTGSPRPKAGRRKISIDELKKTTKCANCGEKGHWKKECKNPYRPKPSSDYKSSPGRTSALSAVSSGSQEGLFFTNQIDQRDGHKNIDSCVAQVMSSIPSTFSGPVFTYFAVESGAGLVDTAAGQPLMGPSGLEAVRSVLSES